MPPIAKIKQIIYVQLLNITNYYHLFPIFYANYIK